MKKVRFSLLLAFPLSLSAQNAKIKIDVDRKIGEIDPIFLEADISWNKAACRSFDSGGRAIGRGRTSLAGGEAVK